MHIIKDGGPVVFIPKISETKYVQGALFRNVLRFNPSIRGAYCAACFFDLRDSTCIVLPAIWAKRAHIDGGDVVEQEDFRGKDNREYVRVHVKPIMRHEHLIEEIIQAEKNMDEFSFMSVEGIPATFLDKEYAKYICGGTFYTTWFSSGILIPMSEVSAVPTLMERKPRYPSQKPMNAPRPIAPRLAHASLVDWVVRDGVCRLEHVKQH